MVIERRADISVHNYSLDQKGNSYEYFLIFLYSNPVYCQLCEYVIVNISKTLIYIYLFIYFAFTPFLFHILHVRKALCLFKVHPDMGVFY